MEFSPKQTCGPAESGVSRLRTPAVLAWLRLVRVYQKIDRGSTEHLRRWGLSVAQFDVLAQVGAAEGLTQQALADRLLVTKGNVTQLLNRMEADGLLVRRQQGRANGLYLTAKGRKLRDEVVPAHEAFLEQQLAGLSSAEQVSLLGALRRLDRTLD